MVALSGTGWRLAPSLVALIDECDQRASDRSTASDGSIGDTAHAARDSDHNPADGWVTAVDVTDDKAGGCDADALAHLIVARRDPRVKYVIWNRTIAKSYVDGKGTPAWQPQPYTGLNAHEKHTHVSVHNTAAARNDTGPWWGEEDIDMGTADEIMGKLDELGARLKAIELREIELDDDLPENVTDQLGEIRRNLRRIGAAVQAEGIES